MDRTLEMVGAALEPPVHTFPPAVFLDRDGTLIEDRGHLRSPTEVIFFPQTVPALRRLQKQFRLFVVTNQSGVAKGELTHEEVQAVNSFIEEELRRAGIRIEAFYVCPHQRSDNCACIKPNAHFLEQAALQHRVDLSRSYAIGDHPCDVELAQHLGGAGLFVLTGHGLKHWDEVFGTAVVTKHIGEAADWILAQEADAASQTSESVQPRKELPWAGVTSTA